MTKTPSTIIKLHQKLLPEDLGQGLLPYVWLVYLFMLLIPAWFAEQSWIFIASVACTLVFLPLYFFTFWQTGRKAGLCVLGILAIGMSAAEFNPGASVFFVYAAAFCHQLGPPKKAFLLVLSVAALATLYAILLQLPPHFYLPAVFFSLMVGGVNIYDCELRKKNRQLKISQDELKKVDATAERERIARDLHDVIGHTFSLISVKAQLAEKLIEPQPDKAKNELRELQSISRKAMAEVRSVVSQYQKKDMASELAKAKVLMQSADIKLHCDCAELPGESLLNSSLAYVLRESLTNIVKHSEAKNCWIDYQQTNHKHRLRIINDCHPQLLNIQQGNGLNGIKERVAQLNGTVSLSQSQQFSIQIEVPVNG